MKSGSNARFALLTQWLFGTIPVICSIHKPSLGWSLSGYPLVHKEGGGHFRLLKKLCGGSWQPHR